MTENANEAREQFDVPQDMMIYYLRLLKRGPLWTPEETPEVEQLQAAHLAHGRKLREAGKLLLNGPVLDNGDLRGSVSFASARWRKRRPCPMQTRRYRLVGWSPNCIPG